MIKIKIKCGEVILYESNVTFSFVEYHRILNEFNNSNLLWSMNSLDILMQTPQLGFYVKVKDCRHFQTLMFNAYKVLDR